MKKDDFYGKKAIWLSVLVMALWGSLYPAVKLGYIAFNINSTADILLFAGIRFIVCGGVISLFCLKNRVLAGFSKSINSIVWSGIFAIVLHYSFTYLGLSMTDGSKTAILKQVGGLFYISFSFLFFKEDKPTIRKMSGAVLGLLGIIAINTSFAGTVFETGDFLILAASFFTVFANVINKKSLAIIDPLAAAGLSQLFGGIALFAFSKALGGNVLPTDGFSLMIFFYICTASIVSYCLWFLIIKNGELSKLFIIKFAEPVFAAIISALILGENILKLEYLIALSLITLGIYCCRNGI